MNELNVLWMETLKKNGSGYLRVNGRSMEPTIKMGKMVLVKEAQPQSVNIGDVVVFAVQHFLPFDAAQQYPSVIATPPSCFRKKAGGGGNLIGKKGLLRRPDKIGTPRNDLNIHQGRTENGEFIIHRVVDKFRFLDKLYFVHRGDNAGLLGMSIFSEDQLVGVVDTVLECHSEPKAKNLYLTLYTLHLTLYYLLRKFFIYFFIFKQLAKKLITVIIKN